MKKLPLFAAVLSAIAATSFAAESKLPSSDEEFVKKAAEGGMVEVKLGEIASTKAKREDVKAFGAQMVKDHSKANAELKTVASHKGVMLPEKLDAKDAALVEKMSKMEGDAFDAAYVKDMVKDHESDVSEFEKAEGTVKDPDVKAFVTKTLPVLKKHLEHIKMVSAKK